MNTRQLKHFLAVLESRSILKAAAQLNISQPAVSKSISKLEEEYGTSLFERLSRGVRPTAFALRFERHARRILADIERSRRAANDIISGTSGTVLIGTGPVFVPVVSAAVHDMALMGRLIAAHCARPFFLGVSFCRVV
jgi:DNA-binding transcriptional LysR family regulator